MTDTDTNGYVPASHLTKVQDGSKGDIMLELTTAGEYEDLKSDAANAGVTVSVADPAGGYRSYAVQQAMYDDPGDWNVQPGVTLAAPGTSSHGLGTCVDIVSSNPQWVISHASDYQFTRDIAGDVNHFHYIGPIDDSTPPASQGETEVIVYKYTNNAGTVTYWVVGNGQWNTIASTVYTTMSTKGFPSAEINTAQWDNIKTALSAIGFTGPS